MAVPGGMIALLLIHWDTAGNNQNFFSSQYIPSFLVSNADTVDYSSTRMSSSEPSFVSPTGGVFMIGGLG
jgi:hypothetical protein